MASNHGFICAQILMLIAGELNKTSFHHVEVTDSLVFIALRADLLLETLVWLLFTSQLTPQLLNSP